MKNDRDARIIASHQCPEVYQVMTRSKTKKEAKRTDDETQDERDYGMAAPLAQTMVMSTPPQGNEDEVERETIYPVTSPSYQVPPKSETPLSSSSSQAENENNTPPVFQKRV